MQRRGSHVRWTPGHPFLHIAAYAKWVNPGFNNAHSVPRRRQTGHAECPSCHRSAETRMMGHGGFRVMTSASRTAMILCLVACLGFAAMPLGAQQRGSNRGEALPPAPTDVQPGSITYEGIAYPYPVSY